VGKIRRTLAQTVLGVRSSSGEKGTGFFSFSSLVRIEIKFDLETADEQISRTQAPSDEKPDGFSLSRLQ
jgi:hypothetical protein